MPTITVEVPSGIDPKELEKHIKKLIEALESEDHELLVLEEESLREFLEDEPDVYSVEDVQG